MTPKYKIYNSLDFEQNGSSKNFEEVLKNLEKNYIFKSFKILDANTNTDVTNEFKQYMYDKGFIFGEYILKEIKKLNENLFNAISKQSGFYKVYSYEGKKGEFAEPAINQYTKIFQELLKLGYICIGHHQKHSIFIERNNPNSPIYKYNLKNGFYAEKLDALVEDSTILSESIQSFVEKIEILHEDWKDEEEEPFVITEEDMIEYYGIKNFMYKQDLYTSIKFTYKGTNFFYTYKTLAEDLNKNKDFKSNLLKEITYFLSTEEFSEMDKLLTTTPSWTKFWQFCCSKGIENYFAFSDQEVSIIEFKDKEYPVVKIYCSYGTYAYTSKEGYFNEDFINELYCRDISLISDASDEDLEKIKNFLCNGRFYQEFDQFCDENNLYNIIPKSNINEKGFEFEYDEDEEYLEELESSKPKLPEGYSEEDEETVEISGEEYNRLSQTLDKFLSKKNPRWCKDGVVEEKFVEFCKSVKLPSICGHVKSNIKRYDDEVKNFEYCKNNNALIYEQFRNVSKFQNVLQDAINCSNNVFTDFLNIKDFATELMDEFSVNNFQKKYNKFFSKDYLSEENKIADYTLRNRYKIENTGKDVFERVSFSTLENVFDAVYVMDVKPPFKVVDLETKEDVTEKILKIAEEQNYMFLDTEEIIRKLPDLFDKFTEGAYGRKYLDKKDGKQIKCLNRVNFKHIIGFKTLWEKNCVPFGFKRNFVLFVDLSKRNAPVYRIDYRKTADFESRKLLSASFEDYISFIPNDYAE